MVASSSSVTVIREGKGQSPCMCVCVYVCMHECVRVCVWPTEMVGVASGSLVPGDVLVVPPSGLTLPCDAALITGHAIVNEAMLTGNGVYLCVYTCVLKLGMQQVWTCTVLMVQPLVCRLFSECHMTLM